MGPDGEWIRDEVTNPAEGSGGGSGGPDGGLGGPDGGSGGLAGAGDGGLAGAGRDRGHGGVPGFSVRAAAAIAVLAAAAGVAAGLLLIRGAPAVSTAGGATPSASAPAGTSTARPALPGLSGDANGQLQMILTGRVLAVSGTSITIGGEGPSVTAAVTRATKVTGTVRGIGGVKIGDEVSAQITGTASHLTVTAIQDPAGNSSTS